MSDPSRSVAEQRFASLVASFAGDDAVAVGGGSRGFGSGALQVGGRIFAMVSGDRLVLKLPRQRVDELLGNGHGLPFDAGKGRPLREWVALADRPEVPWAELAREARTFVAGRA